MQKVEQLGLTLHESDASEEITRQLTAGATWKSMELVGVTHTYHREGEPGGFILGPIDLTLEPGELLFITGGNGSGKTTLAKLLLGLYIPEEGDVYLDGKVLTDETREQYRQLFSVVFSDFYLFESLFGLDSVHLDANARKYLTQLQLDHKVKVEQGALSTIELSQGQRKRLALLTAYLEDRPIYLFDEWAADQDPLFKEIFYHQLLPELKAKGKALIVISHDDRYYHVADRVIKLDYGKLQPGEIMAATAKRALV
jgi:putative ATP-binding cassette transporter